MTGERPLREAVAGYARRLHERGWVANHDGNLTARLGEDRFLCTPTSTSKAAVTAAGLLVVDGQGQRVSGTARPFGELGVHLAVLRGRKDVHAVVHAHPPAATAIACAGSRLLEQPFLAEAVVSLGPGIPTVPFAMPGAAAVAALTPYVAAHDVVLVAGNGVFAWGADVEQAYLRLELVEHLARIALDAERAGGVRPLPEGALPPLLEARRKAGLGLAADQAGSPGGPAPSLAPGPASAPATVGGAAPARPDSPDLASIIREELVRALRRG